MASHSPADQFRLVSTKSAAPVPAPAGLTDLAQMSISTDPLDQHNPAEPANLAFVKGAKRKRLSKACDACHKSKRRCDGTAPCSNCYFASKECTYTDASGRPVPAPRNVHPQLGVDHSSVDVSPSQSYRREVPPAAALSHPSADTTAAASRGLRRVAESPSELAAPKRVRPEGVDTSASIISPLGSPSGLVSASGSPSSLLDPTTTHELTNLFFTHNNPGRMILHKPSFSAALTHEQLPSYLILAVCANAAPHSKEIASKAPTQRLAGVSFFQEAVSIMFDASGRLLADPNLATAQALCLLELHEVSASHSWTKHYRYFDLALKIMEESLDVSRADEPSLTTPPLSPGARTACIERECTRRCFWLIQVMSWINGIYTFRPLRPRSIQLMRHVRLPVDETSFELAVPVQGSGEFMHIPAPRTKNASQFGHLCRILSLYQRLQAELNSPKDGPERIRAVSEVNKGLQVWADSLADHLRFSEANLEKQVSMFETSSNTGAWCFCFMHVLHPCLVLSMTEVDGREAEVVGWVRDQLNTVFTAIGGRAKNTILSACALWSYSKYQPNDPQLHKWDDDFERIWGFRVAVVADQWRKCQEEQRSQIGRTYPVETVVTTARESPPAFTVASISSSSFSSGAVGGTDSSSTSSSAGSSPQEFEPQPVLGDRGLVVVDVTHEPAGGIAMGMGMGRHAYGAGEPVPIVQPPTKKDVSSLSLPSLKASGLLDSWSHTAKGMPSQPSQQAAGPPPGQAHPSQTQVQTQRHHAHQQLHSQQQQSQHQHQHPQHVQLPHQQQHQLAQSETSHPQPHMLAHGSHAPHGAPALRSGQGMPVGLTWLNSEP